MAAFLKAKGFKGASLRTALQRFGHGDGGDVPLDLARQDDPLLAADLAWHVRAWGRWVLAKARAELASFYPTYAEWSTLDTPSPRPPDRVRGRLSPTRGEGDDSLPNGETGELPGEPSERLRLLQPDAEGRTDAAPLNADFDSTYLNDPRKPRWIAKPTVAYLWARTVTCKQCRATLPLLKTRWLCKKDRKRVLLTMAPDADGSGVVFGVQNDPPPNGGNAAQRREHDRRLGAGTMSRTGATCPCCGAITTMADVRFEGRAGRLGAVMTAVVVDGPRGKEYRVPTDHERAVAAVSEEQLQALYADIPFGLPEEPLPSKEALGFRVPLYGFDTWRKLFTNRQLTSLAVFLKTTSGRTVQPIDNFENWADSISAYLVSMLDRLANQNSSICRWNNRGEKIEGTFSRFALPIVWDFAETNPLGDANRWVP